MVIITLGFALLLLIITSIVGNYSEQNKTEQMKNAVRVTDLALENELATSNPQAFSELLQSWANDRVQMYSDAFSGQDGDMLFLFVSAEGEVLQSVSQANAQIDLSVGTVLPNEIMQAVSAGQMFLDMAQPNGMERSVLLCADGVTNADGALCGAVAVCTANVRWGGAVQDLTKTVITSALLVLLAALIAVYVITERTITPLREMSIAAKNFAGGKFDTRVYVRGKDEVAQLAEAFNQMAYSLENLEKMRNSFVANVSHDLRTPMTTIAGFIDSIRDGVIPPEERDHYLEVVSAEVHRLSRLVSSLLDLSRIQAGDRKFSMKPFDICEMARLILISFEQKIDEKKLEVEFNCEEDRISVLADRDAIYQIFYNICHNAVKFSKEGGVLRISITGAKEKKIRVAVFNEGDGIPTEDQPMVFERFYKSDKSRGLDKSGVGLGLYIAKTIITAHGEKIGVNSEPGKNCEFYFTMQRAHGNSHAVEDK